uniref:Uncharacterized protein n=1 Tax=Ditylenchus dipsaci TaxID=166011 RepID=A0A915D1Q3_9BILA
MSRECEDFALPLYDLQTDAGIRLRDHETLVSQQVNRLILLTWAKFFLLLSILKLISGQSTSSPTEVFANGREDCPAADSEQYQLVPYNLVSNRFMGTNITSISIVPASGGPPIAVFPYNRVTFFLTLQPNSPYACETCYEPIRIHNDTSIVRDIVELFNGTYYSDSTTPTIACQPEYERPNVVFNFETGDGRVGEWVITSEHIAVVRPVFWAEGPTLCDFFLAPYFIRGSNAVLLDDFPPRHNCMTRNTAEQTIGLASASFIP